MVPWWNYFLSLLRRAYKEFEEQIGSLQSRPAKTDLIRQAILAQPEPFSLADLASQVPVASTQLIKKVLADLKNENKVQLSGRGRGARWKVVS